MEGSMRCCKTSRDYRFAFRDCGPSASATAQQPDPPMCCTSLRDRSTKRTDFSVLSRPSSLDIKTGAHQGQTGPRANPLFRSYGPSFVRLAGREYEQWGGLKVGETGKRWL